MSFKHRVCIQGLFLPSALLSCNCSSCLEGFQTWLTRPHRFYFTEILRGSSHKFRCLFCHIKSEDRSISKISLRGVHHTWSCTTHSCTLGLWPPDDWLPYQFPYPLWTWSSCCHFPQLCSITWLPHQTAHH